MPSLLSLNSIPNGPGVGPSMAIIGGQQQQQAYDEQATALGQQATYAYQYGLEQAAQVQYQAAKTIGTQVAQYGQSDVRMAGSPLAITAETSGLANITEQMYIQQGTLQSNLYSEQGLQALQSGNAALFQGEGTALSDQYSYELQKAQATNQAWGGALDFGVSTVLQLAGIGAASGSSAPAASPAP